MPENNNKSRAGIGKVVIAVILVAAAAVTVLGSVVVIPAGHTGVKVTLGSVSDQVLQEGLNFKIPFVQTVKRIDNRIVKLEVTTQAFSRDLQTISSVLAVNYRIGKDMSYSVYKNVGMNYESVLVVPAINEGLKAVVAQYTASELVSDRSEVSIMLAQELNTKLNPAGIFVEDINIIDWDFSDEFIAAIEAKQVAEQNLIKTKTEQEQAVVIAEAEAKKQVIAAEAAAQSAIIEAEAQAKKITTEAQAQAEANKLLSESLDQELIEYEKINKWDGQLPMVQGNATPILDISSAAE